MEKLNKENFEVDSWQFKLLERHEANNLNSYTVAELRQLLRFELFNLHVTLVFLECLGEEALVLISSFFTIKTLSVVESVVADHDACIICVDSIDFVLGSLYCF